jgi:alanine transaminase
MSSSSKLTLDTMNPHLREAQYAVRGELVIKANAHDAALAAGEERPFDKVVYCNIGNPQELGQVPITFPRQVLACIMHPPLMDDPAFCASVPEDVIARAKHYLEGIPGGSGAYSHSQGVAVVREEVAAFLKERDGHDADVNHIFLTDGASPAVQMLVRAAIRDENDGFLVPIPQYPLYSASIALYGGTMAGYYLDESTNWGTDMGDLRRAYTEAVTAGTRVRGLVVINPGNPTGSCLSVEDMQGVVEFCVEHGIMLMADEVYQSNIWAEGGEFTSFKKVAGDMGVLDGRLQLASVHSVSKGFMGECGRRGGYVELCGFPDDVVSELYKLASISLCSNVTGQLMMGLMVNPPKEGDASYPLYAEERDGILASLKRRASKLTEAYNSMEGISIQTPEGALYAFPSITLPPKAVEAAKEAGKAADTFYCLQLLDETGVVVVPGSGFGQADGTWHFRSTILPSEDAIDGVIDRMKTFHAGFMAKYA